MKPVHLNLAARPYRDYRPVYAVVVVVSLLVAFLALNNIDTYYRYVRDTRTTRDEIARVESQIRQEHNRADVAKRAIAGLDLASLSKESKFVNAKLAERAFSWSGLLDHLETALPPSVRITSVAPRFGDNGLVFLSLNCEGKSADSMLNAINRFQKDPHFANPFPTSQQEIPTGYSFGINVEYKPDLPRVVSR